MVQKIGSANTQTRTTTLPIRRRTPVSRTTTTPPATGTKSPSIEEYRNASTATRQQWTESQQRRIAENEALLRQLAEITPKVGNLSIKTHLPRGNDLTVEEQIAIIHESVTPGHYTTTRDILSERQREDISNNPNPISPTSSARSGPTQNKAAPQPSDLEWDDFPELNTKYPPPPNPPISHPLHPPPTTPPSTTHNSTTPPPPAPLPCTGPCPIETPHNQGAYLQQGSVPRVWNARWGYSDPPRRIWDAWVRVERGRGSAWDEVEVDGFGECHWWGGE